MSIKAMLRDLFRPPGHLDLATYHRSRSLDNGRVTPTPPTNPNPFDPGPGTRTRYVHGWLERRGLRVEGMDSYHYERVPERAWKEFKKLGHKYRKGKPISAGGSFGLIEAPVVWHYATEDLRDNMVRDALWIEAFRMVDASGDWLVGACWLIERWERIHG